MKYKHYSPAAKVYLIKGNSDAFCDFVNAQPFNTTAVLCYNEDAPSIHHKTISIGSRIDNKAQAHNLFSALREADRFEGVTTVYVPCPSKEGLGMALFNRLIRAAGFEIIDLKSIKPYTLIGLTGPTGAGKGQVANILREQGFATVDADKIAHKALENSECIKELVEAFGENILNSDGTINRRKLASYAFENETSTKRLNSITHPVILQLATEEFEQLAKEGYKNIVFDAPTLFESGSHTLCDKIIAVTADFGTRLERIIKRDNITKDEAIARMSAQKPSEFYAEKADFVITNDTDLESLKTQTSEIVKELSDEQ